MPSHSAEAPPVDSQKTTSPRHVRPHERVTCVAVVGGTHGNERNGVEVARWLRAQQQKAADGGSSDLASYSFELVVVDEANPEAVRRNLRYTDADLNRQFSHAMLDKAAEDAGSGGAQASEAARALALNATLGPKTAATPRVDFLIDLHGTTAPCATALMHHPSDTLASEVAAHLQATDATQPPLHRTAVSAVCWPVGRDPAVLPSIARSGLTLEVGPIPWGVVDPRTFYSTRAAVLGTLAYLEKRNAALSAGGEAAEASKTETNLEVFQAMGCPVAYPREAEGGRLAAIVHEDLRDMLALAADTPVFRSLDADEGVVLFKDTPEGKRLLERDGATDGTEYAALFVNEAAYYEADVAFVVTKRETRVVRYHS